METDPIKNLALSALPQLDQCQQVNLSKAVEFLSAQDIYTVVYDLYTTKLAAIKQKEYWEKVHAPKEYSYLTAEDLYSKVIEQGMQEVSDGFHLSDSDKDVYRLMSLYFSKDPRFEQEQPGYSLNKGLYVYGNIGCGKTTAMRLFRKNQNRSFSMTACREVSYEYSIGGHESITKYFHNVRASNKELFYGQDSIGRCFDDLGVEGTGSNFGNKVNVMAEVMLGRYDKAQRSGLYNFTHVTSNLAEDDLREAYGDRVVSRMNEMFNWIVYPLDAPDKRQ